MEVTNGMNLKRRIEKIEAQQPPAPETCLACGGIDWNTGTGPFSAGLMLSQDDGTFNCMCKRCARSFNARVSGYDEGRCVVSEARLSDWEI